MIELALILVPSVFALVIFFCRRSLVIRTLLVTAGFCHLAGTFYLLSTPGGTHEFLKGWLAADVYSGIIAAICSVLFCAVAVYSFFWIPAARSFETAYSTMREHIFCSVLCLFLSTMSLVAFAANFGLLWVAIEATTLASAPLIAYHRSPSAIEAMWKYLVICSVGIGLALFGTFMLGVAMRFSGNHAEGLSFELFIQAKNTLDPQWFKAAFLFCLAGYGLKMGLAPFHVWMPDAYGESCGPVAALLSGALVNCSFLAVIRVMNIAPDKLLPFCREYLIGLGVISLAVAACFIIKQTDFRRMLAYSSVEHMGILVILWGLNCSDVAMLHVMGHSACKMLLFLTAGNILLAWGTARSSEISGMFSCLPVTGFIWCVSILLICGAPPSPLFLTELQLVQRSGPVLGAIVLLLLFVIFCGMTSAALKMCMGKSENPPAAEAAACAEQLTLIPALLAILPVLAGIYFLVQF
jgi:hydrogenase-4 component F